MSLLKNTNPMGYEVTETEKLKFVIEEISQGIKNLSNQSSRSLTDEFTVLQETARSAPHPLIEYLLLLFRKYSDTANQIKDYNNFKNRFDVGSIGLVEEFDEQEDSLNEHTLGGWQVMSHRLFWYRSLTAILSLIAFCVMASTTVVVSSISTPGQLFHDGCFEMFQEDSTETFDFRAYQLLMVVSLLIYLDSTVFIIYYLLPGTF